MPSKQPNILLITTDQQRYDTCGPRAPAFMRTPHFDHLSREGITFSRAYADCPICVPARVGIMTGKYVFNHNMPTNGDTSRVMSHEDTLPACLRQAGYQTLAVGKMHFAPQRMRHGFDEMLILQDYYRQMERSGLPSQPMRHGLGQNELYAGMATVPESQTVTSWIAEQSLHFIRERRDPSMPFFLWCSFGKPHPPLDPPEPYYSMYRNCPIAPPDFGDWSDDDSAPEAFKRFRQEWSLDLLPPEIIHEARAAYYGLITQIDYNMGRVFAALQDIGLFDDTLILYTSDHGEYIGDHHTGCKIYFHEPSAHVPFVLRLPKSWPDRKHGSTCTTLTTHADILPTLVTAAGGKLPPDVDGLDLTAVGRGTSPAGRRYLVATAQSLEKPPFLGITDGRWKYIHWPEGSAEQLFDLETDPRELKNLAGLPDYSGRQQELRSALVDWLAANCPQTLVSGALPTFPLRGDSEADRRNRSWPGYHTDYCEADIRH